jgi:hypothetical protein
VDSRLEKAGEGVELAAHTAKGHRLAFDGPELVVVSGKNAEGKSSLLRAIMAALGGKAALPTRPVRNGAEKAEVIVDLGDKVVKLRVKPDRSTTLTVEGKDGAVYRSPQAMLDDLVGKLAFDPLEFAEQDAKRQAATLRTLVGLDTADLDCERARVYEQRTGVNRECKLLEGQLAGIVVPPEPEPPAITPWDEEVSVSELVKQQQAALAEKRRNDCDRAALEDRRERERDAQNEVERLRHELKEAEQEASEAAQERAHLEAEIEKLVDPDLDAITSQIESAEQHNAEVRRAKAAAAKLENAHKTALADRARAVKAHQAKAAEVAARKAEADKLTARLDGIEGDKAKRMAGVTFPCAGLAVDADVVTYRGIPLEQASSAEQLQVCLGVAAALNPRLRVLLVRQGNDLDSDRLRQVAEWAREKGYQVLLERVAGEKPAGVVIDAGRVVEDLRATEAA